MLGWNKAIIPSALDHETLAFAKVGGSRAFIFPENLYCVAMAQSRDGSGGRG